MHARDEERHGPSVFFLARAIPAVPRWWCKRGRGERNGRGNTNDEDEDKADDAQGRASPRRRRAFAGLDPHSWIRHTNDILITLYSSSSAPVSVSPSASRHPPHQILLEAAAHSLASTYTVRTQCLLSQIQLAATQRSRTTLALGDIVPRTDFQLVSRGRVQRMRGEKSVRCPSRCDGENLSAQFMDFDENVGGGKVCACLTLHLTHLLDAVVEVGTGEAVVEDEAETEERAVLKGWRKSPDGGEREASSSALDFVLIPSAAAAVDVERHDLVFLSVDTAMRRTAGCNEDDVGQGSSPPSSCAPPCAPPSLIGGCTFLFFFNYQLEFHPAESCFALILVYVLRLVPVLVLGPVLLPVPELVLVWLAVVTPSLRASPA
ncbi:hypothetical protein MSAN_01621400 [Mycena sanguinolenta]|uniref:Uncharacterized protein n=1 Tax=Mycena sanguinolenta TaxID=230812 RepID=A0A8H6XYF0_9AGAR|nr:hypothetical protein MSAN_01621400 [Mycena sanguinolenta]